MDELSRRDGTAVVAVFTNGSNQAIRIPKTMSFPGVRELEARRDGDALILRPVKPSWDSFFCEPRLGIKFMAERPAVVTGDRLDFGSDEL
ncbi:MAG: type II toxin-antitoxin system VapB family antitoxin [Bifidobacteriaceae bacterium]|jgi:antitoxin VapB|nr:type II toxin-antitoxin system VapB family antitoxin [Bifidobacteriaceae bacterium]